MFIQQDGHCFDAEVAHPMHGKPSVLKLQPSLMWLTRRLVGWSIDLS